MEIHRFSRKQCVGPRPTTHLSARDPEMQDANHSRLQELIQQLSLLRSEMLELEVSGLAGCSVVHAEHTASARNLMHYLALRRHDIRHLQSQLTELGLSSLGRTESHVLSALDAVLKLLRKLEGSEEANAQPSNGIPGIGEGALLLAEKTEALLGAPPPERNASIARPSAGKLRT